MKNLKMTVSFNRSKYPGLITGTRFIYKVNYWQKCQ